MYKMMCKMMQTEGKIEGGVESAAGGLESSTEINAPSERELKLYFR